MKRPIHRICTTLAGFLNRQGRAFDRHERFRLARRCFLAALAIDSTSVLAKYNLAFLDWRQGDLERAWEGFQALAESDDTPPACRADCLLRLGHISDQKGRAEDAFAYYAMALSAVAVDTDSQEKAAILADAYCGMAYIEYKRENVERSLELLREALQYDPNHADSLGYLALCYLSKGRTQDAITAGQKAVELEPNRADGWLILGDVYAETGNAQEASSCYERARRCGE